MNASSANGHTVHRPPSKWIESHPQRWLLECFCRLAAHTAREPGVAPCADGPDVIVSLTTTAARLRTVSLAVETLLRQTLRPQRVILWLSDQFHSADLPTALRRQQRRGLEVRFRRDLRSFTKLIHALREHPASVIVTADDDKFYPRDWLQRLRESYRRLPEFVHCHRAHGMILGVGNTLKPYLEWNFRSPGQIGPSLELFPTGVGGVLYPPGALHPEVFNSDAFLKLCPTADDVWFKAMSLLNRVPCVKVAPESDDFPNIHGSQTRALCRQNWRDGTYDLQIRAVFQEYDLLPLEEEIRVVSDEPPTSSASSSRLNQSRAARWFSMRPSFCRQNPCPYSRPRWEDCRRCASSVVS